ncbi:MAG TPA: glycosyltransferase [Polyangiaceae bacterium]|jgi:glycosyltransferase involved in cell wall biosynthesis|nr:glycosyltransferase [Polyangiaceae bacterium]
MSALTIVHVLSSFQLGGQERVALDLATLQRQAGHRVLAISLARPPQGRLDQAFRDAGVETSAVPKSAGFDPSLPFRLARSLVKEHADVIHSHNPHALIYGAPAAALLRVPSVYTKHGRNPDIGRRKWLRRVVSRWVDAYVAVTPALGEIARAEHECAPERLHVISNGIDAVRFTPRPEVRRRTREELGIPENAWVVGTVGRLSPEKDQSLLIDAMTPLLSVERQLVIVGDGPERESLHLRAAATWKSAFVHMTGARTDAENLLAAFDVFALTSRSEGLPLVLLEAMAMRLPVVSTAVGGVPDIVEHGVTGFLVPPRDKKMLGEQLAFLSTRPAIAAEVAEVARHAVLERHTMQRMAEAYEKLYEGLLAERARGKPRGIETRDIVGSAGE